jgi:pilus assembly protein Flp/PilA
VHQIKDLRSTGGAFDRRSFLSTSAKRVLVPHGTTFLEKERDMKTFINMLKDEAGASAAEYALILAIVGGAIALAALALGGAVSNSMNRATNCITTPGSASC